MNTKKSKVKTTDVVPAYEMINEGVSEMVEDWQIVLRGLGEALGALCVEEVQKGKMWASCARVAEILSGTNEVLKQSKESKRKDIVDEMRYVIKGLDAKKMCVLSSVLLTILNTQRYDPYKEHSKFEVEQLPQLKVWCDLVSEHCAQLHDQIVQLHVNTPWQKGLSSLKETFIPLLEREQEKQKQKGSLGAHSDGLWLLDIKHKELIQALRYIDPICTMFFYTDRVREDHPIRSDGEVLKHYALTQMSASFGKDGISQQCALFKKHQWPDASLDGALWYQVQLQKEQHHWNHNLVHEVSDGFNPDVVQLLEERMQRDKTKNNIRGTDTVDGVKSAYVKGMHILEWMYSYPNETLKKADNHRIWNKALECGWLGGYKGLHPLWLMVGSKETVSDITEVLRWLDKTGFKADGSAPKGCKIKIPKNDAHLLLYGCKVVNRLNSKSDVYMLDTLVSLSVGSGVDINKADTLGKTSLYLVNKALKGRSRNGKSEHVAVLERVFEKLVNSGARLEGLVEQKGLEQLGATKYIKALIKAHEERLSILNSMDKKYVDAALEYAKKLKEQDEKEQCRSPSKREPKKSMRL